jgi:4a-hydroxytetrahydrobiopterin dehydratase
VATLLDPALIADTLASLPGWQGDENRLWREVHVTDEQGTELRRQVGVDAGAMGHEPQVEQVDGGLRFVLRTEESGGVTELDVVMASHISDLVHRITASEPGVDAHRDDAPEVVFRPAADNAEPNSFAHAGTASGGTPLAPVPSAFAPISPVRDPAE